MRSIETIGELYLEAACAGEEETMKKLWMEAEPHPLHTFRFIVGVTPVIVYRGTGCVGEPSIEISAKMARLPLHEMLEVIRVSKELSGSGEETLQAAIDARAVQGRITDMSMRGDDGAAATDLARWLGRYRTEQSQCAEDIVRTLRPADGTGGIDHEVRWSGFSDGSIDELDERLESGWVIPERYDWGRLTAAGEVYERLIRADEQAYAAQVLPRLKAFAAGRAKRNLEAAARRSERDRVIERVTAIINDPELSREDLPQAVAAIV